MVTPNRSATVLYVLWMNIPTHLLPYGPADDTRKAKLVVVVKKKKNKDKLSVQSFQTRRSENMNHLYMSFQKEQV